ncbi:MAG: hypothetical protein M1817_004422 [Caeruleum heppii]|nr:MAG: hypothetical protein M1817_004422 [Caeruleum heppii]
MANEQPPSILRPIPRRTFEITPASAESSAPATPPQEPNPTFLEPKSPNSDAPPSRTRSILNLTSSTLVGIYSPTSGYGEKDEPPTPGGIGAQTPNSRRSLESPQLAPTDWQRPSIQRRPSSQPHHLGFSNFFLPLALRTILLFTFGIAYGVIVTHLHDNRQIAPVQVEGIERYDWRYLGFWGVAGVGLGSLLPWVDFLWENNVEQSSEGDIAIKRGSRQERRGSSTESDSSRSDAGRRSDSGMGADWNPVVRSVGAFVGIAFAIRKLPWQSTLQVSLTLALVNPVLWYLIDRSKPGFVLSALFGIAGTAVLLGINPDMVPSPGHNPSANAASTSSSAIPSSGHGLPVTMPWLDTASPAKLLSAESIGVGTWIASVLFCSCVCFGNIGRRLALKGSATAFGGGGPG